MKKLLTFAASICAAALMFTGCPSVHSNLNYLNSAEKVWIIGDTEEFGKFTLDKAFPLEGNEESVFTGEFTATTAGAQFKILIDTNANWDTAFWSGDTTPFFAGEKITCSTIGGLSNCVVSLDIGVKYKITVDASNASAPVVEFTAIGGEAAAKYYVVANGFMNETINTKGVYTTKLTATEDSLAFTVYDGTKYYAPESLTVGTKATLIADPKNACTFETEPKVSYEITIDTTGEKPTIIVKSLKPIELKTIVGDLTGGAFTPLSTVSTSPTENVYGYTVTVEESMVGKWGYANGLSYKVSVSEVEDWNAVNFGKGDTATPEGEAVELVKNPGMDNAKVDVEVGKTYCVLVTTTATTVTAKWITVGDIEKLRAITVNLDATLGSKEELTLNSNISWGGAKGYWTADKKVFGTTGLKVKPVDNKVTFYVTESYAASGWALEQALSGKNFKFEIGEDTDNPKGGWFALSDELTQTINYADKAN